MLVGTDFIPLKSNVIVTKTRQNTNVGPVGSLGKMLATKPDYLGHGGRKELTPTNCLLTLGIHYDKQNYNKQNYDKQKINVNKTLKH